MQTALANEASAEDSADNSGWQAHLALRFVHENGATVLRERRHRGPLRVQKALYPEGSAICHAIIVHTPGGVVGGDCLTIEVEAGGGSHVLLATPGAAKWYRANGKCSRQSVTLEVGAGARLEWLPQETIFFDHAEVALSHTVSLAADAVYLSAEILCFGRSAAGESYAGGKIRQSTSIRRDGKLIWFEQGTLAGAGAAMQSAFGLAGHSVCATLIASGAGLSPPQLSALREAIAAMPGRAGDAGTAGVTHMKALLVVRYLGNSSELARRLILLAWHHLRPPLLGCEASVPRIWNT